jgi:tRNA(adenine34) deaminase
MQALEAQTFADPHHPFHLYHMGLALAEAKAAADADEVPVGAIIISLKDGILAQARNQREALQDPTAHAEMIAITQAASAMKTWRLTDTILYVTLEPCPMCAGAIVQARIPYVVFGAWDKKAGACESLYTLTHDPRLNHRARVLGGVMQEECAAILSDFFQAKRLLGKK